MMNRSKTISAKFFALVLLFSSLTLATFGHFSFTLVTALPHPAVKEGKEAFRGPKSRAIPEWNLKNLRSATLKQKIDEPTIQVVDPSKLQDKNETRLASDHHVVQSRENSPTTKLVAGRKSLSLTTRGVLLRFFHRLDDMDKMLVRNTLPLIGVTSIVPFLQSIDLFWVNQLGDTLAVSAQSASNTLFQFAFGLISFIPSVTATLVSKNYANKDLEKTESTLITALLFGLTASFLISMTIFANPSRYLGTLLKDGNPALPLSVKYMRMRCLSLVPQTVTYVCFGAFRGMLDYKMCIKFALMASGLDLVLKPLLIHTFRMGILGSATSTLLCDSFTAVSYLKLMRNKGFLSTEKLKLPSWVEVLPMLKGSTLQARSFAMHLTNMIVARKIQSFDDTGVFPAAFSLAMQTFFTGGIMIYAMAMSVQTLYPNAVAKCKDEDREIYAKTLVRRLVGRGFLVGTTISSLQALLFPMILRTTPIVKVREAAFFPVMIAIVFQCINGIVCVGEAIMVGSGMFSSASLVLIAASIAYTGCLRLFPQSWGINGVSTSFGVFNIMRLLGFAFFLPTVLSKQRRSHSSFEKTTSE